MEFSQNVLYGISNKKYLSELLQIDKNKLKNVSEYFVTDPFIQKKKGKEREFYNPSPEHKNALKKIVKFLSALDIPDYITGGIRQRSYVSNVELHRSNKFGIIIDVADFFPSTNADRVYKFFKYQMKQSYDIAKILKELTTVTKGDKSFLPQGYPTSPILSFLAYLDMYTQLEKYAEYHGLCFTAYYDDLTFSSDKIIHKNHKKRIIKIIKSYSLDINKKKSKVTKLNNIKITGCIIRNGELKAPQKLQKETYDLYKLLKSDKLKNYSKSDIEKLLRKFTGKISAIQMVEKKRNFPNYKKCISEIKSRYKI